MDIMDAARKRYTCKSFDSNRHIDDEHIRQLCELLRLSPSSVNAQPWHFIVADNPTAKARVAKATEAGSQYNTAKVLNASHVLVLCARTELNEQYLTQLLDQEALDGRLPTEAARSQMGDTRNLYINLHRHDLKDLQHWMEKQVYLALGTLLLAASSLDIDACPIEGFNSQVLDNELGLREQGYTSVVLVALGYHSADDFNAALPKSRLPEEQVFTYL